MAKPTQLLIIEPATELKFQGPFRTAVASYMRLTNPTDHDIYFKIKTTAPKKYCVRPNCGLLEPRESQEIAIVLQPFIFDSNEKNKHKFMVQSMVKPEDEDIQLEELWKKYPENLMDSKLRCVFDCPVEANQATPATATTTATAPNSAAPAVAHPTNEVSASSAALSNTLAASNIGITNDEQLMGDEMSLLKEMKRLKEEESALRQENLQLKEQVLQLRTQVDARAKEQPSAAARAASGTTGSVYYQNPYSPPPLPVNQQPIFYGILALVMCFVGIILGKLIYSETANK
ncbi:vesicle-associated membrane protein-associated protein B-like [Anopheles aquasalis]|uniref:vesicle-associated membrane protein-associated protein B-like n=1 Tax=Anopheles aquasalis TaxID=42839 RepID=UPI00215AF2CB|nr:vesicle-associated membrane protein-associated protein B-like [Anopheles aquasalis]